jgi:putative phage-type endonuclease
MDNHLQGTPEWFEARLGMVTASRMSDVIAKSRKKGELSATAATYMYELISEMLTGKTRELQSAAMDWGSEYESEAVSEYEVRYFVEVERVGFITHPKMEGVGGSPDGLVGSEGIIEIKCPYNTTNHLKFLLGGAIPKKYACQMQANMWITGRKWCDFISFDPRITDRKLKIYVRRIDRDSELTKEMESKAKILLQRLQEIIKNLKSKDV